MKHKCSELTRKKNIHIYIYIYTQYTHTHTHIWMAEFSSASESYKMIGSTQFGEEGHTHIHTHLFILQSIIHKLWHQKYITRNTRISKCNVT